MIYQSVQSLIRPGSNCFAGRFEFTIMKGCPVRQIVMTPVCLQLNFDEARVYSIGMYYCPTHPLPLPPSFEQESHMNRVGLWLFSGGSISSTRKWFWSAKFFGEKIYTRSDNGSWNAHDVLKTARASNGLLVGWWLCLRPDYDQWSLREKCS